MKKRYLNVDDYQKLESDLKGLGFDRISAIDLIDTKAFLDVDQKQCSIFYYENIDNRWLEAQVMFDRESLQDLHSITGFKMTNVTKPRVNMVSQYFSVFHNGLNYDLNHIFTKNQAYNLICGRPVLKSVEGTELWLEIDLTRKNDSLKLTEIQKLQWNNYKDLHPENFVVKEMPGNCIDLNIAVSQYNLTELDNPDQKKKLLNDLRNGKSPAATLRENGKEHQVFLGVNVNFGIINLFDAHNQRIQLKSLNDPLRNREKPERKNSIKL